MKNFSMPSARAMLRRAVKQLEPPAEDYIDWDAFEGELEKTLAVTDVSKAKVASVFGRAVTRARHLYHQAVQSGTRFAR